MKEQQTLPARLTGLTAADVFDGPETLEQVLAEIEAAARSIVPDVTTQKGRKSIASVAAKVARSKTFLDGLGKDLVSDWKKRAAAVDAERRKLRERLDDLKDEVRRPLTAYEQAEADRQAKIRARIAEIRAEQEAAHFQDAATARSADLEAAIERVALVVIDDGFAEFRPEAEQVKDATLFRLNQVLDRVRTREAAEAKAAAEQAEREARERAEREERIRREAAEQAKREAEAAARAEAERERQAAEAERERIERERATAEQRARDAREAQIRAERESADAARRERARIDAEAHAEREAAERRIADREHRATVNRTAVQALVKCSGLRADQARAVVTAIARSEIPAIRIDY
ncbi:MAG: hypothetical protein K9M02_11715 [Thiohalocapsa sp.]|nr:hypothetical protein [Thiohalocapsa sp.]